ncbi:uncharacterized protein AB675_10202 [Cyphellophora attinorum]|uniref:Uncharacterized protein n=1 Tax=Cyphellophora attinorum TaxID=1664694 RepID=A0A0N1HGV0_9EURO|nr:uncharacterized protein AB675_10202 [Phialophora attinorum]KPI34772.1 hypothetical protein AB675_10202 [Phialophora attinorum]
MASKCALLLWLFAQIVTAFQDTAIPKPLSNAAPSPYREEAAIPAYPALAPAFPHRYSSDPSSYTGATFVPREELPPSWHQEEEALWSCMTGNTPYKQCKQLHGKDNVRKWENMRKEDGNPGAYDDFPKAPAYTDVGNGHLDGGKQQKASADDAYNDASDPQRPSGFIDRESDKAKATHMNDVVPRQRGGGGGMAGGGRGAGTGGAASGGRGAGAAGPAGGRGVASWAGAGLAYMGFSGAGEARPSVTFGELGMSCLLVLSALHIM